MTLTEAPFPLSPQGTGPLPQTVSPTGGCSKGSSRSRVALRKPAAPLSCQDTQQSAQKRGVWNPAAMAAAATRRTRRTFQRTAARSPNASALTIPCSIPRSSWRTWCVSVEHRLCMKWTQHNPFQWWKKGFLACQFMQHWHTGKCTLILLCWCLLFYPLLAVDLTPEGLELLRQ